MGLTQRKLADRLGTRQQTISEWETGMYRPRGASATLLSIVAERVVNLAWRLKRAQRMQNQSIDYLGLDLLGGYYAKRYQEKYRKAYGLSPDDPGVANDHLLLGRIATVDWSNSRVLDRMLMYERRIESSFYRTMTKLKKLQIMRSIEWEAAEEKSVVQSPAAQGHNSDFVKQSVRQAKLVRSSRF